MRLIAGWGLGSSHRSRPDCRSGLQTATNVHADAESGSGEPSYGRRSARYNGGMFAFDANSYGPLFAHLWSPAPLPALGPGKSREELRAGLASLTPDALFAPAKIVDRDAAAGCVAGLWLWNNFLDESHTLSQEIETPSGSYWHGIMHRREPDFFNAKYWFRRVGRHAIFPALAASAAELAAQLNLRHAVTIRLAKGGSWDAFAYVDLCEAASGSQSELRPLCEQIAAVEWQLLFDHDYRAAIATSV